VSIFSNSNGCYHESRHNTQGAKLSHCAALKLNEFLMLILREAVTAAAAVAAAAVVRWITIEATRTVIAVFLRGELGKLAVNEGNRALTEKSLVFATEPVTKYAAEAHPSLALEPGVDTFVAAVLEYVTAECLELAGKECKKAHLHGTEEHSSAATTLCNITVQHLHDTVTKDDELTALGEIIGFQFVHTLPESGSDDGQQDGGAGAESAARVPADVIVCFLPTYAMLEQQVAALRLRGPPSLRLHLLHSSVDLEECMSAILSEEPSQHRGDTNYDAEGEHEGDDAQGPPSISVVLATSVAESSITIPAATLVVDLCLNLEMIWSDQNGTGTPHAGWCSRSQAQQRSGRVGRCQNGEVIRLIPAYLFHKLPRWEVSKLAQSSLRDALLVSLISVVITGLMGVWLGGHTCCYRNTIVRLIAPLE
jgi:hypothetical protein